MGYPSIRRLRTNTFCDGGVVRANDGALLAELQGNLAKNTNISESTSYFDVSASGIRIFTEDGLDYSDFYNYNNGISSQGYDGASKNGIVWAYTIPRPATLTRVSSAIVSHKDIPGNDNPTIKINQFIQIDTYFMKGSKNPSKAEPTYNRAELGSSMAPLTVFSVDNDLPTMNIATPGQVKDENVTVSLKAGDCIFLRTEYRFKNDNAGPLTDFSDFLAASKEIQLCLHLTFKEEHQ
tara:strand:- start:1932 stop:2642 length:711 start_codon:yes stop_codon:yes gene_type:complete